MYVSPACLGCTAVRDLQLAPHRALLIVVEPRIGGLRCSGRHGWRKWLAALDVGRKRWMRGRRKRGQTKGWREEGGCLRKYKRGTPLIMDGERCSCGDQPINRARDACPVFCPHTLHLVMQGRR